MPRCWKCIFYVSVSMNNKWHRTPLLIKASVSFKAMLSENAFPGRYRIDIVCRYTCFGTGESMQSKKKRQSSAYSSQPSTSNPFSRHTCALQIPRLLYRKCISIFVTDHSQRYWHEKREVIWLPEKLVGEEKLIGRIVNAHAIWPPWCGSRDKLQLVPCFITFLH